MVGLFCPANLIERLDLPFPLAGDRYDVQNPTRQILDIVRREFSLGPGFLLSFLYILAKKAFHPAVQGALVHAYLTSGAVDCSPAVLALFLLAAPDCLRNAQVLQLFNMMVPASPLLFAVGSLQSLQAPQPTVVALGLGFAEYCTSRGLLGLAEEYIKMVSAHRLEAQTDPGFPEQFKRVRGLYYSALEKESKDSQLGISGLFGGLVKGIVGGIGNAAGVALSKSTSRNDGSQTTAEEVKWCPVAKRWLINGQIPPDEPEETKPAEAPKPAGPPPKSQPKPLAAGEEAGRRQGVNARPRFVAYKIGASK